MPAISIEHLSKEYKKQDGSPLLALNDVSFVMDEGIHGLLGPNGAGKSTLISVVSGSALPSKGTAHVRGIDVTQDPIAAKLKLGVVPQEVSVEMAFSVEEVLYSFAGMYGVPVEKRRARVDEVLEDLDLADKKTDRARSLSGGMKRRLMIAKAIMHRPEVLILDEPTAGVDVALRRKIWELVRRLNQEGTSILFTTHYLEEAEQLCERITVINKGEIVEDGKLKDIKEKYGQASVRFELHDRNQAPLAGVTSADQAFELTGDEELSALTTRIADHYGKNIKTLTAGSASLESVFLHLTK